MPWHSGHMECIKTKGEKIIPSKIFVRSRLIHSLLLHANRSREKRSLGHSEGMALEDIADLKSSFISAYNCCQDLV